MSATQQTRQLREDLESFFSSPEHREGIPPQAPRAFLELLDLIEADQVPVILASDDVLTTGEAAQFLGVSRMTVARLVDRGEITACAGGTHRRISAAELHRYQQSRTARRSQATRALGEDITASTGPDQIISTR